MLKKVIFKEGVKECYFPEHSRVTSVTLPSTATSVSLGGFSALESISIPNGVRDVYLKDCKSLKKVVLPQGLTKIANSAFANCESLVSITLPDSLTNIGNDAFSGCVSLKSISIPKNVTYVGPHAFYNCTALETYTTASGSIRYNDGTWYPPFENCDLLKKVIFKEGVKECYFPEHSRVTSVTLPSTATSVSLGGLSSLTNIKIPSKVRSVYLNGCKSLTSVALPASVVELPDYAFKDCTSLTSLNIPAGVVKIGHRAFEGAQELKSLVMPAGLKSLGNQVVNGCLSLKYIKFMGDAPESGWGWVLSDNYGLPAGYVTQCDSFAQGFTKPWRGFPVRAYTILPATPSSLKGVGSFDRNTISWGGIFRPSGYELWRSTDNRTFSKVYASTKNSFTNTGLALNKTYYYKVRAYRVVNKKNVYSNFSPVIAVKTVFSAPSVIKVSRNSANTAALTWGAVSGATGYEVHRSTNNRTFAKIAATSKNSFTSGGLAVNGTYYYKVRPYRTVGKSTIYGTYSTVATAGALLSNISGLKVTAGGADRANISWKASTGATGYEVYRATDNKSFTRVYRGTATNCVSAGLTPNKTYYYKVRPYRILGKSTVYGNLTGSIAVKPTVTVPGSFKAVLSGKDSAVLSWGAVVGASGYEIQRSESGKPYAAITTTTARTYTNTGLTGNKTYTYRVRAYRLVGKTKVYGNFTTAVTAKTA